jgi:hypothetical protein
MGLIDAKTLKYFSCFCKFKVEGIKIMKMGHSTGKREVWEREKNGNREAEIKGIVSRDE